MAVTVAGVPPPRLGVTTHSTWSVPGRARRRFEGPPRPEEYLMTTPRPHPPSRPRRPRLRILVAALAGLVLLTGLTLSAAAAPESAQLGQGSAAPKPTIVLVHGAFADSSGWNDVAGRL